MTVLTRRSLIGSAAGAAALVVSGRRRAFAQNDPIKIPMILPMSGPAAYYGNLAKQGAEIAIKLINEQGGVLGRTVEPIFGDDKGKAADAVAVAKELIGAGHNILGGGLLSGATKALLPVLKETNSVLVAGGGVLNAFTHEDFTRQLFPSLNNDYVRSRVLAKFAADKFQDVLEWGGAVTESQAYVESYNNFARFATEYYGAIGKKPTFRDPYINKYGTTDFRAQLGQMANDPTQGLFHFISGADALTFWQQSRAFGLHEKLKVTIDQTMDVTQVRTMKENLPPNMWTVCSWYYGMDPTDPWVAAFVAEYGKQTGDNHPDGFLQLGEFIVSAITQTLKATGGKSDSETFMNTLEGLELKTLKVKQVFRKEDHHCLSDVHLVNFIHSDEAPGFKVPEALKYPAVDFVSPPTPGQPLKL